MNTETQTPAQAQTVDLPTLSDEADSGSPLFTGTSAMPFLGQLKVKLAARLGNAEMSVAELTALQKGGTIKLDRLLDQPIELLVEGHVVAQGSLVAVGEHFGLRITAAPKIA
jgi:flagellar motor switch protein FliN/FliY